MSDVFTLYKLIVLYMAQQSREELTNSQISQFVLDRDYTDYFHLQQVLSELVETGLLKKEQYPTVPIMKLRKREAKLFSTLRRICRQRLRKR